MSEVTKRRSWSGPDPEYELFADLYPRLRRFAAVVADADMEPDDLVQDALAATLRNHELSELDQPVAYLKRAMVNHVATGRRRAGHLRRLLPRLAREATTTDAYPSDLAVLADLDPTDRAIVYLADCEGEPLVAIADLLGLTPGAVRKRASRARRRLRAGLSDTALVLVPGMGVDHPTTRPTSDPTSEEDDR